ncbi:MAG TPA: hypothetical protein VHG28_05275 [Longimicrobiaceae bacterium]|nr:hypothetical protein [Longimicrobiaceae bacterium]
MMSYSLHLRGIETRDRGLPGPLLRDLLGAVDDSAKGAVRLRLEGRSQAKGGFPPAWVNQAAAFDMAGFTEDAPGVTLRAPTLREALPARFEQQSLFPEVDPSATGLMLMLESLEDALRGNQDSDAYDEALLKTFGEFRRLFHHGVQAVEMRDGRPGAPVLTITPDGMETVRQLRRETPRPQRVRVAGKVDEIRHSDRAFTLILESGESVRGVLAEAGPEELARYFGRSAVVSGMAQFRPSGTLLRVDADLLEPVTERDVAVFSEIPEPLLAAVDTQELRRPQVVRSGINAMVSRWPGDETDDEIFAMIEEMS